MTTETVDPVRREALLKALPLALLRNEWALSYHPQRCLVQGKVIGAAVQVNWVSPTHGNLSAELLLPLMAEAGLIDEFSRWVLLKACDQMVRWQAIQQTSMRICIEMGWHQCASPALAGMVAEVLEETGVPAALLAIGLQAPTLHNHPAALAASLTALHGLGVEVVAQGFGSELSHLDSLCSHPVDRVHLSPALIQGLVADGVSAKISGALIEMAHGLGWQVLADGVVTQTQLDILVGQGCDQAQGDFLGHAVDGDEFESLLFASHEVTGKLEVSRAGQRTLLLVDDEENIVSSLKRLFRRDGYRILTANSGAEALEVLAANDVNVILSDQRMPGMTGVEFLRQAKVMCPASVRITLSGYTDLQSIIDAVNEGAVYKFLTKPWEDARLREHVTQAFEQFELASENVRLGMEVRAINRDLASANHRLERMVISADERRRAMQSAAGASRDMLDLIPVSIFGVGSEGILAYANRCAISEWPEFASALGEEPEEQLTALMDKLNEDAACQVPQGVSLGLSGRRVTAWKRTLTGAQGELGSLIILHANPTASMGEMELSA